MVRFYGLCDGKIMVIKTIFLVFVWKCLVFRKLSARAIQLE